MNKYACDSINLEYAFFNDVTDSFLGQKVIISCDERQIIGQVVNCSLLQTKVKLFGDVSNFIVYNTSAKFLDTFIEMPLSPSILGRQLDFFGNPIDELPVIIPVSKASSFYVQPNPEQKAKSEIVGEKDWLIKNENFKLQKGQVKTYKDFVSLLPMLGISNLALIIVELDYNSKKFTNLIQHLEENNLNQISVFFKSQSQNDIYIAPFCISQVVNYLAGTLGFDVLIVASHSELLKNADINKFYFAHNLDSTASFEINNSITVINI